MVDSPALGSALEAGGDAGAFAVGGAGAGASGGAGVSDGAAGSVADGAFGAFGALLPPLPLPFGLPLPPPAPPFPGAVGVSGFVGLVPPPPFGGVPAVGFGVGFGFDLPFPLVAGAFVGFGAVLGPDVRGGAATDPPALPDEPPAAGPSPAPAVGVRRRSRPGRDPRPGDSAALAGGRAAVAGRRRPRCRARQAAGRRCGVLVHGVGRPGLCRERALRREPRRARGVVGVLGG